MRLSEILSEDRILVPLEAETLEEAIGLLCHGLETSGTLPKGAGPRLAGEFFSGARGEVIRVNEWVILAAARSEQVDRFTGTLGLAPEPFDMGGEGEGGTASVLLLLLTPRRVSPLKLQAIPALSRFLREKRHATRLKGCKTPSEISGFSAFMEVEVQDQLLVADGLTPLQYRVYADTPLAEVVGLMVRQGIRAVPVVGQKLEFLGLITSGDAIRYLLPERLTGTEGGKEMGSLLAREVMVRSIMCISEEQSLVEAANLMVNKGVSQLPVVRGGELVGFLSVDSALHLLFGPGGKNTPDGNRGSFRLSGT
jgi:CBS domain-containing protein/mannitol/fructose-specific phosphotransferase system IIA component (Ntr-type)